jgi:hypothetical protein
VSKTKNSNREYGTITPPPQSHNIKSTQAPRPRCAHRVGYAHAPCSPLHNVHVLVPCFQRPSIIQHRRSETFKLHAWVCFPSFPRKKRATCSTKVIRGQKKTRASSHQWAGICASKLAQQLRPLPRWCGRASSHLSVRGKPWKSWEAEATPRWGMLHNMNMYVAILLLILKAGSSVWTLCTVALVALPFFLFV